VELALRDLGLARDLSAGVALGFLNRVGHVDRLGCGPIVGRRTSGRRYHPWLAAAARGMGSARLGLARLVSIDWLETFLRYLRKVSSRSLVRFGLGLPWRLEHQRQLLGLPAHPPLEIAVLGRPISPLGGLKAYAL
jgi:hypothetical protein